jgi:hypothetical protein
VCCIKLRNGSFAQTFEELPKDLNYAEEPKELPPPHAVDPAPLVELDPEYPARVNLGLPVQALDAEQMAPIARALKLSPAELLSLKDGGSMVVCTVSPHVLLVRVQRASLYVVDVKREIAVRVLRYSGHAPISALSSYWSLHK